MPGIVSSNMHVGIERKYNPSSAIDLSCIFVSLLSVNAAYKSTSLMKSVSNIEQHTKKKKSMVYHCKNENK